MRKIGSHAVTNVRNIIISTFWAFRSLFALLDTDRLELLEHLGR